MCPCRHLCVCNGLSVCPYVYVCLSVIGRSVACLSVSVCLFVSICVCMHLSICVCLSVASIYLLFASVYIPLKQSQECTSGSPPPHPWASRVASPPHLKSSPRPVAPHPKSSPSKIDVSPAPGFATDEETFSHTNKLWTNGKHFHKFFFPHS